MKLKNANWKVISVITLILALIAGVVIFFVQQSGIGSFSTKAACDSKRSKILSEPFYVYCTPCATKYSDWGALGYYSAGCFGSGSMGEECMAAGGTCEDVNCNTCTGVIRECYETLYEISDEGTGIIYEVINWDDVCDKMVFKLVCNDGYYLSGREYDLDIADLGQCLMGDVSCDWASECSESVRCSDGTRKTRDTDGQTCNDGYCKDSYCLSESDLCAGLEPSDCDGTTKLYDLQVSIVDGVPVCQYASTEVNSAYCGYVPPECSIDSDCGDGVDCTIDSCNSEGICEYDDSSCDDGGNQSVDCNQDSDCDDDDVCTSEVCDSDGKCSYAIATGPDCEEPGTKNNYLLWGIFIFLAVCFLIAVVMIFTTRKKKNKRRR